MCMMTPIALLAFLSEVGTKAIKNCDPQCDQGRPHDPGTRRLK